MVNFRHLATALAILFAAAIGPARAEGFLSVYEDLPLAPGLAEVAGSGLSFDSPAGRIVEAHAHGAVKTAEVLHFYASTLPQLGWTRETDKLYRREAEVLRLETANDHGGLSIRFAISPE